MAREAGIPNVCAALNGDVVQLDDSGLRVVERVWSGRTHIDRGGEPIDGKTLAERKGVAEWGILAASLVVSARGKLIGKARITSRGVLGEGDDDLLRDAEKAIANELRDLRSPRVMGDDSAIEDAARRAIRRFFHAELGKKPVVAVHVHRLDDGE
jgi:mRNA degradation ribonuclease J1/J2